jgi:hypothetical protein
MLGRPVLRSLYKAFQTVHVWRRFRGGQVRSGASDHSDGVELLPEPVGQLELEEGDVLVDFGDRAAADEHG